MGHIWTVHLHNQWKKGFPNDGWMMRLLDGYKAQLEESRPFERVKRDFGEGEGRVVADDIVESRELVSKTVS